MFFKQYINKLTERQLLAIEKTAVGKKKLYNLLEDALKKAHYDGLYSGRESSNITRKWYLANVKPKAEYGMTKREENGFYSIPIMYYSKKGNGFHISKFYTMPPKFKDDDVYCWTYFFEPDLNEFLTQDDIIGGFND